MFGSKRKSRVVRLDRRVPVRVVYFYLDQRYGVRQHKGVEEYMHVVPVRDETIALFGKSAAERDLPEGHYVVTLGAHNVQHHPYKRWVAEVHAHLRQM